MNTFITVFDVTEDQHMELAAMDTSRPPCVGLGMVVAEEEHIGGFRIVCAGQSEYVDHVDIRVVLDNLGIETRLVAVDYNANGKINHVECTYQEGISVDIAGCCKLNVAKGNIDLELHLAPVNTTGVYKIIANSVDNEEGDH